MARKYVPIEDLTMEGLREDIASTKKLWVTLENVRRANGGWKKRPGVDRIDGAGLPAVGIGSPKIFYVYKHPASNSISEIIRPTGTGAYDAWTATTTNYLDVDDVTADGDTSIVSTATKGAKTSFTFGNLVGTWNSISSIRIHVNAERHATLLQKLTVSVRIASVDYEIDTLVVSLGTGYIDTAISSSINPATSLPWTPTEVDALEVIIEKFDGAASTIETNSLSDARVWGAVPFTITTGSYKTAEFNNVATAVTWLNPPVTTVIVSWSSTTIYTTGIGGGVAIKPDGETRSNYVEPVPRTGVATHTFQLPNNPLTGTAPAFNLLFNVESTATVTVSQVDLVRTGDEVNDSGTIKVSQVYVSVEGDGDASLKNSLIMVTSKAFLRVAEDLSTYSDIQDAATTPTASEGNVWDATQFINKLYITNGQDQLYEFPTASNTFTELSGAPVGRTIASFGSRLMQGDITEGAVRSPHRLRWSAINNAANWTDASSGNMELDETAGKLMKLKPLVEQSQTLVGVLACYKTQGIYHVRATGNPAEPFEKKLMDSSSGCLARGSLVGMTDSGGRESHVFLGQTGGTLNVMRWNGANIEQFGFEIVPLLESLGDIVNLEKSIGVIDTFGNYVLMFPTTGKSFLQRALVYNFNKKVWTTWTLGNITALGTWTPNTGRPITVLGRPDSFAYKLSDTVSSDDAEGSNSLPYTSTLETGDISLMIPEVWRNSILERVWVVTKEDASTDSVVIYDGSADGGVTYLTNETDTSSTLVLQGANKISTTRLDYRIPGRRQRVRLKQTLADGKPEFLQFIFEMEDGGIESP